MKKIFKTVAVAATAATLTISLAGCGLVVDKAEYDDVKIAKETVLTINDDIEVSGAYYGYYYSTVYNEMYNELAQAQADAEAQAEAEAASDAETASDAEAASDAAEEAPEIVVDDKAVREEANSRIAAVKLAADKAKENGIELSAADTKNISALVETHKDYVESSIGQMAAQYGAQAGFATISYPEYLDQAMLTNADTVADIIEDMYYANLYYKDIVASEYITAKHILVEFPAEGTEPAEGQLTKEEALAKITDIKAQLDGGADFDKLMNENSTDPGLETAPNGYTFTKGAMVAEFETAAFALAENQISDIVETSYGYHIIKKTALDSEMLANELTNSELFGALSDEVKALIDAEEANLIKDAEITEDKKTSHYKLGE